MGTKASLAFFAVALAGPLLHSAQAAVSLATFDEKARKGGEINVVFFGGSLTWGANATDPQLYSYRARLSDKLQGYYPQSRFHFWDASIGGTGSQLGIFRLDRDVLSHKPDLVFLEFTVNDSPPSEERLASYEAIVRRTIESGCPIFEVMLPVRQDVLSQNLASAHHLPHQDIARAYNCPWVDVTPFIALQIQTGKALLQDIWANPKWPNPHDATHPGNLGYQLYAEAIWDGFLKATKEPASLEIAPPEMLHRPTYLHTVRRQIAEGSLPQGWTIGQPDRISAAYDWLMSRWLDSVVIVAGDRNPGPLTYHFNGSSVLLLGESTLKSGKYRVLIDGSPSRFKDGQEPGVFDASGVRFGGNAPHVRILAQDLSEDGVHSLSIEPLLGPGEELRIESIGVAGKAPSLQP